MRNLIPVLIVVVGIALLTFFATQAVDRGPFQRGLLTPEVGVWTSATSADTEPLNLYAQVLGLFAEDSPTGVQEARRMQTWLVLPLFGLAVFLLAWRRAGAWAAAVAGLAAVSVGPTVLHAGFFHPGLLAGALGLLALAALKDGASLMGWIIAALLAAVVGRLEPALGWAFLVLLAVYALIAQSGSRRWIRTAVVVGVWILAGIGMGSVAPGGPIPTVNGFKAYQGNGEESVGLAPRRTASPPLSWWTGTDFVRVASIEMKRRVTPAEAERYWAGRARGSALADPLGSVRRLGVKSAATLQPDPLPFGVGTAFLLDRTDSSGLSVSVWLARLLLPLGVLGLILARGRVGGPVWVGVSSGVLAAILTLGAPETRAVSVGALLVAAAVLARWAWEGPRIRIIATGAGAVLAVLIVGMLLPRVVPGMGIVSEDSFQLGALYDREGRGSSALREYERALRMDPANPTPRYAIAGMLARDNVLPESRRELEVLREQNRGFYAGLLALSRVYQQMELFAESANVHGDLIPLDPHNPELYNNLGTLYVQIGYYDQAVIAFQNALALAPDYAVAQDNLNALKQGGISMGSNENVEMTDVASAQEIIIGHLGSANFEAAQAALAQAKETFGEAPGLHYAEGTMWLLMERYEDSIAAFEKAKDTSLGETVVFLNNLGAAYARAGRVCDAICTWKRALKSNPNNRRVEVSLNQAQAEADSAGSDCVCEDSDSP